MASGPLVLTGFVLSYVEYIPDVAQTELSLFGIRLLVGPISAAIFLLSLLVLYFYPINETRYNEILGQINEMEKRQVAVS